MDQGRDKNWRDLCHAAATEQDPNKLMALVAEILKTLDARNRKAGSDADCGGASFASLYAVGQTKDQSCKKGFNTLTSTTVGDLLSVATASY
jgi:hypothetical protein